MDQEKGERGATGSQTLQRGLDVLHVVANGSATLAELASQLGLSRSTTHRLANALLERRYLTLAPGRGYQLGPKLLELGYQAQTQTDLMALAHPVLADLSEQTGLPSFLGRRDDDHSLNLLSVPGRQRVAVITPVGTRRRLAETSLGKALMLDDTPAEWKRHFAAADPAHCPPDWQAAMERSVAENVVLHAGPPPDHVRAIATPVRDFSGKIVAGISMVTVSQYLKTEELAHLAPQLKEAGQKISAQLGHRQDRETSGKRKAP
ncbi:IclR family transcriptional regulator [Croceibacterium sp. TMG7-5b_MA50]|uniref:IclR family transcriptional regulator n=1 Tax=Croceibacterium sp. TMG7-5b_MA50 TaxID=3121290 RepID=UPI003221D04B